MIFSTQAKDLMYFVITLMIFSTQAKDLMYFVIILMIFSTQAKDLMYFVIILLVFVISYAIAAYSVMYPNSEMDFDLLVKVLRLGYWNLYGELLLEEIEGTRTQIST
jgi:hypothetical protein